MKRIALISFMRRKEKWDARESVWAKAGIPVYEESRVYRHNFPGTDFR